MTNDANESGVSRAYRDLATEKTRENLDEKILQMAAREVRPRYGLARAWTRPVAWAAVAGLSLVIVLQVNQTTLDVAVEDESYEAIATPSTDIAAKPSSAAELPAREEAASERFAADDSTARMRQQAAKRKDTSEQPVVADAAAPAPPISAGGGASGEADAGQIAEVAVTNAKREAKEVRQEIVADADAFTASDRSLLDEAEEQAHLRSGSANSAVYAAVASEAAPPDCDETARAAADSWYDCVVELRELGLGDIADQQLEALLEAHPDFEEPVTSK